MVKQTYQEVLDIILQNLAGLYRLGVRNINKINLQECKGDYHTYFHYRKIKHPKRYERLDFCKSFGEDYSNDLGQIIKDDFIVCGFIGYFGEIMIDSVLEHLSDDRRIEKFGKRRVAQ